MKRWLVVLLILLAVIILISPGLIGRLAEENMEQGLEWAEQESAEVSISTEQFNRGWFTSEGRHRVSLQGPQFEAAAEKYRSQTGRAELPSLIIDTRLDHGLVPVTSLGRDSGSLMPGLASTISTFRIDRGDGDLVDLPGTVYSNVDLSGASSGRFLLEPGKFEQEDAVIEWQGADITFHSDISKGAMAVEGTMEPWSLSTEDGSVSIGAMNINVDQVQSDFDLDVGTFAMDVGAITVVDEGAPLQIASMALTGESTIEDARFNATSTFAITGIEVPAMGDANFSMDIAMNRLDAASLSVITDAFQEAQASADPELALQTLLPKIEGDLQNLLTAGGEIRINELNVTLPQGTVETRIIIDVPEMDADAEFTWPAVLLAMTASVDLRIPAELYDMASMMNPQAGSLVAMGILIKDGEDYVMAAEYAQGLFNVNGVPMPIPIPGM